MASKGVKGSITSGMILIVIAGAIFGWAKVNNIQSSGGFYGYFKAVSDKIISCGAEQLKWTCKDKIDIKGSNVSPSNVKPGNGNTSLTGVGGINISDDAKKAKDKVSNLNIAPPTGNSINLNGVNATSSINDFNKALNSIKVAPEQKVAYKRSEWKHWIGSPCDTRDVVLINQGKDVKVNKTSQTCHITSGTWVSAYDGKKFTDPSLMDIDHTIPLGYAASHGGQSWSSDKKEKFANDVTQLMAVSAKSNRSKSDKGPALYMPGNDDECNYSKIWVSTANKYGVNISAADKVALTKGLATCNS